MTIDDAILAMARRQQGNVTHGQLIALELGRDAIAHRVLTQRLHRVHRGVYAVGRPPSMPVERAAAAVLACGDGAALSHQSALAVWDFAKRWESPMHVTVPRDRRRPEINIHRCPSLTRADIRTHLGIRVTSPARTVLDCAPTLTTKRLTRIVNDGRRTGHLRVAALQDVIQRFPNHPGASALAALVADASEAPTRSHFEDEFLAFCKRFGLPTPRINTYVNGYEVDALFPSERVIVELDSWGFHKDHGAFETDRERDATALAAGLVTVRVTWERMTRAPQREADRLKRILAQRRGG